MVRESPSHTNSSSCRLPDVRLFNRRIDAQGRELRDARLRNADALSSASQAMPEGARDAPQTAQHREQMIINASLSIERSSALGGQRLQPTIESRCLAVVTLNPLSTILKRSSWSSEK